MVTPFDRDAGDLLPLRGRYRATQRELSPSVATSEFLLLPFGPLRPQHRGLLCARLRFPDPAPPSAWSCSRGAAILWGPGRSKHSLHSHISGHGGEVSSVDGIAIAQHIPRRLVPGKRFPHLLHGPLLRGVFRHPEVHHPASLMRQGDENEQDPEGRRRHGKKNRCLRSAPDDWSGRFPKSGKAVCGAEANTWPPYIAPPQSPI